MEVKEYKEEYYRIMFGVEKNTFYEMLKVVHKEYQIKHLSGGRKDGTTPQQRLEITLKYLRQYLAQRYLAP